MAMNVLPASILKWGLACASSYLSESTATLLSLPPCPQRMVHHALLGGGSLPPELSHIGVFRGPFPGHWLLLSTWALKLHLQHLLMVLLAQKMFILWFLVPHDPPTPLTHCESCFLWLKNPLLKVNPLKNLFPHIYLVNFVILYDIFSVFIPNFKAGLLNPHLLAKGLVPIGGQASGQLPAYLNFSLNSAFPPGSTDLHDEALCFSLSTPSLSSYMGLLLCLSVPNPSPTTCHFAVCN